MRLLDLYWEFHLKYLLTLLPALLVQLGVLSVEDALQNRARRPSKFQQQKQQIPP